MIYCKKRKMSKLTAKIVLASMQAKDKGAKRIYYCSQHKAWHITSQEKRGEIHNSSKNNPSLN